MEQSQSPNVVGNGARGRLRVARVGVLGVLVALGSSLAGGCSDSLECKPILPEGAVYTATLLGETTTSDKCHIVEATRMSPFQVTVGKTTPTAARPDCSVTPAAAPPAAVEIDVKILSCIPSETEMLGVDCEITYKAGCGGRMLFYFAAPPAANVNWTAQVIEGLLFRIQDRSPDCFSDQSNCLDEYAAKLVRIK